MPSICLCPECRERVLVESLADGQLRLRCPHCGSEFQASTVAESAEPAPLWAVPVEDVPVEAVPVEDVLVEDEPAEISSQAELQATVEVVSEAGEHSLAAESAHEAGNVGESIEAPAEGFDGSEPASSNDFAVAADAALARAEAAAAEPATTEPATIGPDIEPWTAPTSEASEFAVEEPVGAFSAMGEQANAETASRRARRQQPQVGMIGNLIGVVLGGVVGIGLGYLVLIWIQGREGDFLHLWDSIPRFLLPSEHPGP